MAIKNACDQLNERLAPFREKLGMNASMKDLAHAAYFNRVNLTANGYYKTPDIGYKWGENTGMMFFYFTLGAAVSEVEVDMLTGHHNTFRTDIMMDIGRTINYAIDVGQIEGGFMQGAGLFTMEETLFFPNGQLFSRGPGNYKIPGFRDIPQDLRLSLYEAKSYPHLKTIQSSKGIGEPPLFLGSSVFFAIRDAIKAARKESGVTDTVHLTSPATPERIRVACADRFVQCATIERKEGERSFFVSLT
ncbi:Xanthine dehydrogenase [Bifiguratus adelaidae]|uniref:Xanthine dehydrogenase n=1 Tax=Bifiguratus adelaidae TaxID=1938954 RepID=A0A261Y5W9_9FUNG|nr:Xanthine dehydrogenase [Bifiguratus adelaidae]